MQGGPVELMQCLFSALLCVSAGKRQEDILVHIYSHFSISRAFTTAWVIIDINRNIKTSILWDVYQKTTKKREKKRKNISSSACFSSKSQWTFPCKYKNMEFSLGNTKKSPIKIESMGCLFPCFFLIIPLMFLLLFYFFWSWFCVLCFLCFVQFWII